MSPEKTVIASFLAVFGLYGASLAASAAPPWVSVAIAATVTLAAAFAFVRDFRFGMCFVLAELVAGSLGQLASFGHGVSLRMALFAVALVASSVVMWRDKEARDWVMKRGFVAVYAVLGLAIAIGVVNGIVRNGFASAFSDLNAYLYFLLMPAFMIAFRTRKRKAWAVMYATMMGATVAASVLTLLTFVLFTHATPEPVLRFVYKWVRDYGMGEITRAPGGFYRVFFQAHLYELVALPWFVVTAALTYRRKRMALWMAAASLVGAVVFVSFSRTFWLAETVSLAAATAAVILLPPLRRSKTRFVAVLGAVVIASVALPFLLSRSVGGATFGRLTGVAGEAAASSRMNLLKAMWPAITQHPLLGSGFGKELTYETKDPRLLAYFPSGEYTTSAFEWGWLDFWLKMGILGPLAFLMLVATVLRLAWTVIGNREPSAWEALWIGTAMLAIATAHVFSPWLNHPLGIGFVLFAYAALVTLEEESRLVKWSDLPLAEPDTMDAQARQ